MSRRVQLIRHTTGSANTFTGLIGELTVDTTAKEIRVHDGLTLGGIAQARKDLANVPAATVSVDGKMAAADKVELAAATASAATNTAGIATNVTNIATNTAAIVVLDTDLDVAELKLAGIEAGATADQTGAQIKTAYQAEANAFTDTKNTKLAGIETAATADQTKTDIDALGIVAASAPVYSGADASLPTAKLISDNGIVAGMMAAGSIDSVAIATDAVGQDEIAANVVGQSEIKTTFQAISGSQYFTATGGVYILGSLSYRANALTNALTMESDPIAANDAGYIARWRFNSAGVGTFTKARLYYINASPPYDLGDGQIPLFIFAAIDNSTRAITMLNLAVDPPWAYNGPTDVKPVRRDRRTGKIYRLRKDMSGYAGTLTQAKARGATAVRDYAQAFRDANMVEEEITQGMKNADKDLIPTPWHAGGMNTPINDFTGQTVVLIDPASPVLRRLLSMMLHDEADIGEIIQNYMIIGNTPLVRNGPAGLQIAGIRWQ